MKKKWGRAAGSNREKASVASALPTEPAGLYFEVFRSCIYFECDGNSYGMGGVLCTFFDQWN